MDIQRLRRSFKLQLEQSDCGVACLASIVKFHGSDVTLEKLRELSGTTKHGTTLLGLYQAAQQLGFDTEGGKAETVDYLRELNAPAILHIIIDNRLQHYFVYYGFDRNECVTIGDPAKGIISYTKKELNNLWKSKSLLKLVPNKNFVRSDKQINLKKQWVFDLLKDDLNVLVAALFTGLIISVLGLTTAIFSQKLIDKILPSGDLEKLIISLMLVGILLLARSGLSYVRGFFIIKQGIDFNNRIIQKFYGSLLNLPKSFFDSRKTGELIARMNDTRRIQATISLITGSILIDFLILIVSIGFVFAYSSILGFVMLSCLPIYGLLVWLFNDRIIQSQKAAMSSYALTESHYVDTIQGIGTLKATNRESFFEKINKQTYGYFQNKILELGTLNLRFNFFNEIIGIIFLMIVIWLSAWMVLQEVLQLGEMVALLSISGSIIPSIGRLVLANIQLQEAKVAFGRMFEFASLKPEFINEDKSSRVELCDIERLFIKNVSFRFPGRKKLLNEISLSVCKGEMIAILGESGSGKSSFLQVLQKFYQSESGVIEVNESNLDDVSTPTWRNLIGVVPQEVKLFNGNLLYNLTLSDHTADYTTAIEFCKEMGFDQYFQAFPQNYMTILGEEGTNISGGQRQLVAIARALFRRPKLLLLDEATASMDRNMESFTLELLLKLKSDMAIVIVTHRIQTARKTDFIYILENGKIIVSGNPNELMTTKNLFSESMDEVKFS